MYAVRRRQGLMLPPGNPKKILGVQDLVRSDLKFINRQRNSGTRISLDEILRQAGIDSHKIRGYENEEFTHSAVAALVASGAVDCGAGIEAAATQFNLDFVFLNWESYWFVLPKEKLDKAPFSQFLQLLQSEPFNQCVAPLKGYETSRSGTVVVPDEALAVLLF